MSAPGVGSRVVVTPSGHAGRAGETGVVVGPDRRWFPRPRSVFVRFGPGLTLLIAVADLTVAGGEGS